MNNLDTSNASTPAGDQWIEVYNATGADLKTGDNLRLVFTTNQQVERDKVEFILADSNATLGGVYTPAPAPGANATDNRVTLNLYSR